MVRFHNRQTRRAVARDNLPMIEALSQKVLVHKPDYSHITVLVDDGKRIDWWPGSHKWRYQFGENDSGEQRGSVLDFIKFVRDNRGHA